MRAAAKKLSASYSIGRLTPNSATTTPPTANPTTWLNELENVIRLLAGPRFSFPTTSGIVALAAVRTT